MYAYRGCAYLRYVPQKMIRWGDDSGVACSRYVVPLSPSHSYNRVYHEMPEQKLIGKFVALPESTLDSKEWKELTSSTRCVYTAMLRKYRRTGKEANGRVKWKQPELAKKAGYSLRTVNTCLQELLEKRWITVWEPGGRWLDGTIYEVEPKWANGKE